MEQVRQRLELVQRIYLLQATWSHTDVAALLRGYTGPEDTYRKFLAKLNRNKRVPVKFGKWFWDHRDIQELVDNQKG